MVVDGDLVDLGRLELGDVELMRKRIISSKKYTIDPNSRFTKWWDIIIIVAL